MSHLNSSQVSKKIRSAIKAKLVELGAYVDEELPDYIMVMLLNKKPKETLTQDLKLFLNKNTDAFVDWLLNVLHKLDKVVSSSEEKRKKKELGTKTTEEKEKKSVKRKGSSEPKLKSKIVAIVPDDSDGEYDPEKILKKSLLASSIQVPERKRGVEANKNLVLKAVAEADQSIKKRRAQDRLRDKVVDAPQPAPPPPPPLTNKTLNENTEVDLRDRLRKKRQQRKEEEERRQVRRRSSSHSDQEKDDDEEDLEKMRELVLESIKRKQQSMSKESRKTVVAPDHKRRKETSISHSNSSSRSPSSSSSSSSSSYEDKKSTQETKTKFIVTLEGINSRYFKKKRENEEDHSYELKSSNADSKKRHLPDDRSFGSKREEDITVCLKSKSTEKKKPEAKVAPMLPVSNVEKPKRKRITAPDPSPSVNPIALVNPPRQPTQPSNVTTATSTICRYWPNCIRGTSCFFKHPDKLTSNYGSATLQNKYSWTPASLPP